MTAATTRVLVRPTTTTPRLLLLAITNRTRRRVSHTLSSPRGSSLCKNIVLQRHQHQRYTFMTTNTVTTTTASNIARQTIARPPTTTTTPRTIREIWNELRQSPLQYATIPAVAACMAMYTNWIAVKMLFYPIDYMGTEWYREPFVPYGVSIAFVLHDILYLRHLNPILYYRENSP